MAATSTSDVKVSPQVIFRRVRGRIVPIRASEAKSRQRLALSGVAHAAAGLGVAAGTGYGVAKLVRHASKQHLLANASFRVNRKLLKIGAAQGGTVNSLLRHSVKMGDAAKLRAGASRLFHLRNPLLAGGAIVGGALLGAGALRLHRAWQNKPKKDGSIAENATASALAAGVTAAAYYRALPVGSLSKVAANTFARLKGLPRPHNAIWWRG
jgi:hypothetical protein